jgi:hypothetical protein
MDFKHNYDETLSQYSQGINAASIEWKARLNAATQEITAAQSKTGLFKPSASKIAELQQHMFTVTVESKLLSGLAAKLDALKNDAGAEDLGSKIREAMLIAYIDAYAVGREQAKNLVGVNKTVKNDLLKKIEDIIGQPSENNLMMINARYNDEKKVAGHKHFESSLMILTSNEMEAKPVIEHLFNRVMELLILPPNEQRVDLFANYMKLLQRSSRTGTAIFETLAKEHLGPQAPILIKAMNNGYTEKGARAEYAALRDIKPAAENYITTATESSHSRRART